MRHNRRDDGQLSCRKREMKTMNANTALDGHTTVIKMAERGGVPLFNPFTATGRIYTSPKRPSRWPRTYIYVPPQFRFYAFVKARPPAWLLLHVSEVSSSSVR